jgi:dienelactone hydrolase
MTHVQPTRRRRARAVAAALTLAVSGGVLGASAVTASAATKPAGNASAEKIRTYAVGKTEMTFTDFSRPTNPNGSYPGADSRTLLTVIYYPAEGTPTKATADIVPVVDATPNTENGPYPLIIFSHGATARGIVYESEAEAWASAGYVVAAPDFPLSNTNAQGGVTLSGSVGDVKNQPADDTFVIDQVLDLNTQKTSPLYKMVDPKHIGAAGHSNGAITTYGLVYSECCTDKRIRAAVAMSGVAAIVDDEYFKGKNTPLLILHGDADPLVPYSAAQSAFKSAKAPKFLLTFVGGSGAQGEALFSSTTDFWDRYLKGDRSALAQLREDANVPGATTFDENVGSGSRTSS